MRTAKRALNQGSCEGTAHMLGLKKAVLHILLLFCTDSGGERAFASK